MRGAFSARSSVLNNSEDGPLDAAGLPPGSIALPSAVGMSYTAERSPTAAPVDAEPPFLAANLASSSTSSCTAACSVFDLSVEPGPLATSLSAAIAAKVTLER